MDGRMTEQQKLIKKLEFIITQSLLAEEWKGALKDAVSEIRKRIPVPAELEGGGRTWWEVCGDCHGIINQADNYCKHCGRPVAWE